MWPFNPQMTPMCADNFLFSALQTQGIQSVDKEIDLTYPKANVKNHGFTPEERSGFDQIVKKGFIDTFREFCDEGGHYTWWSQMHKARDRNIGWRIDYFCVSSTLKERLKKSEILSDVMGSDHCPILLELKRKRK